MGNAVRVTQQFAQDFALVAAHYGCTDEEIVDMKRAARADMENAEISFGMMAQEVEEGIV